MNEENNQITHSSDNEFRIHKIFVRVMMFILAIEWTYLIYESQWLSLFLVSLIILTGKKPML